MHRFQLNSVYSYPVRERVLHPRRRLQHAPGRRARAAVPTHFWALSSRTVPHRCRADTRPAARATSLLGPAGRCGVRTANVGVAVSRVASPGRAPAAPSPRFAPISRFRRGRCGRCGRCGLRVAAFVVPAWRSSLISGGWVWRRQGRRGGVSQCSIPVLTAGGVAPLGCMVASVKPQGRPRSRPRRCHCRRGRGDSSPVSCCRPLAAFPGSIVAVFGAAF